ncbi:cuticle protein CP1499-like [Palaemon carinicauda]|uniref:cuticle protein CP1499-like n=1 Tax=Palaemon carinicauda TaxID=392227 RepID=UPI0035B5D9EC
MKTLVILAIFGVCVAFARYTPEVQQAREEFFRAFRAAERAASLASPVEAKWYGAYASSQPAGLPGSPDQVPFTAEVQAAADAFQRAYRKQLEAVGRKYLPRNYHPARITRHAVNSNSHALSITRLNTAQYSRCFIPTMTKLWDDLPNRTPEVQQAREEFFRAFRAAERAASLASPVEAKWYGAYASSQPAGLPGSPDQVPFTAEVQAAADAFQRAYRKQLEAVGRK